MRALRTQFSEAYVVTLSERFKGGIPDLYVQTPGYMGTFVELKFMALSHPPPYSLNLSALQRVFIRRVQDAGGSAGWALGIQDNHRRLAIFAGTHTGTSALAADFVTETMDMKALMDRIGRGPWKS